MPMNTGLTFASVAAGGASGACARYAVGLWLSASGSRFPWSILVVNVLGCLVAGFATTLMMQRANPATPWQLLLITGFLGGFTTFSAFSVDTLRLAESGHTGMAALNVFMNVGGALAAVGIGWLLARQLAG